MHRLRCVRACCTTEAVAVMQRQKESAHSLPSISSSKDSGCCCCCVTAQATLCWLRLLSRVAWCCTGPSTTGRGPLSTSTHQGHTRWVWLWMCGCVQVGAWVIRCVWVHVWMCVCVCAVCGWSGGCWGAGGHTVSHCSAQSSKAAGSCGRGATPCPLPRGVVSQACAYACDTSCAAATKWRCLWWCWSVGETPLTCSHPHFTHIPCCNPPSPPPGLSG